MLLRNALLVIGMISASLAARADIITFSIQGSDIYGNGNLVIGTTTINTTTGVVQSISFTAGGKYESGIDQVVDRDYYVGVDQVKFTFTDPLIGYKGGKFNLNGPNTLYVGDVFGGVVTALPATPEPSSLVLLATGLLGTAGVLKRRLV